ncbi:acyl-CoA ligase (AMP-forming), exosortase A system-associated [Sphingobium sufflavum]|uniref:acyl-CoA ligase (AMP-forming), exosortase A system-associated n=1 Tax=Sphingobium sufflavum TaxID=1129547 RepID=UPI001F1E6526|nr:acyl-CoA ligase (AMP-forming), exosortase A system-associated [Sphingobium sufflavum]MCE7797233.1 acyl-CoA ligase (AMP-forming), exosortase A system-associated [Sphingobium sufflavum]
MRNLAQSVRDRAACDPDGEALVYGERRLTYGELWAGIAKAAAVITASGVGRGEHVAVLLEKRVETILALYGAAWAGAVFIPINPMLKPDQVTHIMQDSGARTLITTRVRAGMLGARLADCPALEALLLVGGGGPAVRCADRLVQTDWTASLAAAQPLHPVDTLDEDIAAILYTSGSTGLPKGVVLSQRNLIEGARSVVEYIGNGPDDRILSLLPLSFDAGLSQVTTAFASGACVVLVNYIGAEDIPGICVAERITGITGVPPLWAQLVKVAWPQEACRLRYVANTGGRMHISTLTAMRSLYREARVYLMYGLTEAFRSTYLPPEQVDRRPDSIGKAIPNARILVVRPDGSECLPGEEGELVHIGAQVAQGYLNQPALTAQRFRPSPEPCLPGTAPRAAVWSGDIVRRDEEGYLYFVERKDNMIKTSGYRVSPTEIESVVNESGDVAEVAAIGIEDEDLGQVIAVAVVRAQAGDLRKAVEAICREKLPIYMLPRHVIELDALPRNPNGKYDYHAIRRLALDAMGELVHELH